jgi:hypothetical protein
MRSVTGVVKRGERTAVAELNDAGVPEDHEPLCWSGQEIAEEAIHSLAEYAVGTCDQFCRVCEMPSASLVDRNLRPGKQLGEIAYPSSVIEVDVRDDDCCKIVWIDAELGELSHDDGCRARGARLDEAWFAAPDEVTRSYALVAAHPRVDHEDVIAKIDHVGSAGAHGAAGYRSSLRLGR